MRPELVAVDPLIVTNKKDGVRTQIGMSMAPALWLTNFALLYTLKPEIAAFTPAQGQPIPVPVAAAIRASDPGRVPLPRSLTSLP